MSPFPPNAGRFALAVVCGCAMQQARSLDLAEAYRLALQHDAAIAASRAAAEAGRERVPQARAQFFPQISASVSRFRNDLDTTGPMPWASRGPPTTTTPAATMR